MKTKTTQSIQSLGMIIGNLKSLWIFGVFLISSSIVFSQSPCSFQPGNPAPGTVVPVCFYKFNIDQFDLLGCLPCQITGGAIKCGNGVIAAAGFSNYDMISYNGIECINPTVLPVELISFSFQANSFNWITGAEINNDYFTIEKSTDMENWIEIIREESIYTSDVSNSYSVELPTFESRNTYFKLSQVDYDGVKRELALISYDFSKNLNIEAFCYPNPSETGVFQVVNYETLEVVNVYSMEGKMISSMQLNNGVLDLSTIQSGVYSVQFIKKNGDASFQKLIKKA